MAYFEGELEENMYFDLPLGRYVHLEGHPLRFSGKLVLVERLPSEHSWWCCPAATPSIQVVVDEHTIRTYLVGFHGTLRHGLDQ